MEYKDKLINNDLKKILDVPYISQYDETFESEWQNRSCGIACITMLLNFYNLKKIEVMKLISEGVVIGGYSKNGWLHESLVRLLRNHGINAYAQEFRSIDVSLENKSFEINKLENKMIEDGIVKIIQEIEDGHPVMISVNPGFNTNKDNHLILVIGYDFSATEEKLIIHDPDDSSKMGANSGMPIVLSKIAKSWRKYAIFSYL